MSFKGDLDIWKDFIKSVKKLDRSNVVARDAPKPRIKTNPERNKLISFIDNRKSMKHIAVRILTRSEIKKFHSQNVIDLHGYTREVDDTLETFCSKCILNGIREITIITGKGDGVVKAATSLWLKSHPELVIGFFAIKDSRMESGAFGVRLRGK